VMKTIDLLDGSREQLVEMAAWLSQRKAWALVEQLAKRFPERFNENVSLLYPLAEAQLQQGRKEAAEETALRALKANADMPQEHNEVAYLLQERGLFAWAEREYRQVMDLGPPGSLHEVRARFLLSEMLHDQQRDLDAAKALQPITEALDKDQAVLHVVARLFRQPGSVRSRMQFFFAEHAKATGKATEQIEHLREAVKQDSTDADVLIAMYRAPAPDDKWRQDTSNLLRQAIKSFRDKIRECEQQANESPIEEGRALYQRQLALELNQFAWLVANTEGDYDEALRCSQRSLELLPENAGYLDTLGRCYFAKQDYENAVKCQSRALKLEPHSGQMQRQLKLFQQAQEASRR
jgi:tetratricopeptide (TPR) repeat protein